MLNESVTTLAAPRTARSFYITGGTLRRDAECYVERKADAELHEKLNEGQFCYVLTSRQMGKSSLMVRAASRLREEGTGVAVLDLTAIGQNVSPEQWYGGLLSQMAQQFDLEDELIGFWRQNMSLGPLQRWLQAIRHAVLPRYAGPVVFFIDEIDAVLGLPFSTDEFFAGIRELYNFRTEDAELERLTFCLLGVASPSDLIRDTRTTPFNIGQRIELRDFTEVEAAPLAGGLCRDEALAGRLLKRVLYWTGGHPYLTQRLCKAVAEDAQELSVNRVDELCEELFFAKRASEQDDNLLFVRERMLRSEVDTAGLLALYAKVRQGSRMEDDDTNPLVTVLRLAGLVRVEEGLLRSRNRIYAQVFDGGWVAKHMPDAEAQRQRAAYRRGVIRTGAVAAVLLALFAALAALALARLAPPLAVVLGALAVLALVPTVRLATWSTHPERVAFFSEGLYRDCLAPGDRVFALPFGAAGSSALWQAEADFGFTLAGGYLRPTPPWSYLRYPAIGILHFQAVPPAEADLRQLFAAKGVTRVVVPEADAAPWREPLDFLGRPRTLGEVLVYPGCA